MRTPAGPVEFAGTEVARILWEDIAPAEKGRTPKAVIRRGVHYMDSFYPGWWTKVDTEDFDLGNPYRCIQFYVLGIECADIFEFADDELVAYGFIDLNGEFNTDLWVEFIGVRRAYVAARVGLDFDLLTPERVSVPTIPHNDLLFGVENV